MKKILIGCLALLLCATIQAQPQKVIKFASEATYPPFEFAQPSGELAGFDIDIARAICAKAELTCTFSNQPWESLIPALRLGKFDAVISSMDITDERKKQVDFSESYFSPSGSFVTHKDAKFSPTLAGLKGKTVGVQKGTTFEKYLGQPQYKDVIKLKTYTNFQGVTMDLKAGRSDIILADTPIVEDWLKNSDESKNFIMVGDPIHDPKILGVGFGIALKKGNTELLEKINQGLAEIKKDGTYQKIFQQYFPHTKLD
jgi:arginine transport system substrate-binding protein